MNEQDRRMSETMSACWVAFAKTGKPACAGAPKWPAYDPKTDQLMEFGTSISVHAPTRAAAFDIIVDRSAPAGR
jgi:para-nitrobenzyl esterase